MHQNEALCGNGLNDSVPFQCQKRLIPCTFRLLSANAFTSDNSVWYSVKIAVLIFII